MVIAKINGHDVPAEHCLACGLCSLEEHRCQHAVELRFTFEGQCQVRKTHMCSAVSACQQIISPEILMAFQWSIQRCAKCQFRMAT